MQQLKALEILKFLENGKNLELLSKQKIKEAIVEFEDLENRRCNNCKYVFSDTFGLIYCSSPKSPLSSCVFPIHPNFCCNKWESK